MSVRKSTRSKQVCAACHESKVVDDFYISHSELFSVTKRMPICKECLIERCIRKEDGSIDLVALDEVLQKVDRPFIQKALDGVIRECEGSHIPHDEEYNRKVLRRYWRSIQSLPQYTYLTYSDSDKSKSQFSPSLSEKKSSIPSSSSTKSNNPTNNSIIYSKEWKGHFFPEDIDTLNDYYDGLQRDYKIITENHRDYARKIAKASLMMDKAYEDVMAGVPKAEEKYEKFKNIFDSLSRSAKFSEDKRSINDVGLSSFSVIVSRVAEHNWIPEHTPLEKDDIDKMLDYLSTVTKSL